MTKPSKAQRKVTAHHEAGHAVIGRILTLACGPATIEPNYEDATWGVSRCPGPSACVYEWEKRGKVRSENAVWIARMICLMAGAEAEAEFFGKAMVGGDDDDRYQIQQMLDEVPHLLGSSEKCEARLRRMTRMLIRRHKSSIRRLQGRSWLKPP
jgi:ATP-dependent Zn protease